MATEAAVEALRGHVEYLERESLRTWDAVQRALDMAEAALSAVKAKTAEAPVATVKETEAKRQHGVGVGKPAAKQRDKSGNKCVQKNNTKRPAATSTASRCKGTRVRGGSDAGGGR